MRMPSTAVLALVLIASFAFWLRVFGLQYGLPAVYNPDDVAIMARALSFAKGTLNPHNFLYPTLYFYVLFGWVGTYLGFVWLSGGVSSVTALQQLYFTDPTGIYTAGRLLGGAQVRRPGAQPQAPVARPPVVANHAGRQGLRDRRLRQLRPGFRRAGAAEGTGSATAGPPPGASAVGPVHRRALP